jgi:uncharacterized membrane protein
MSRGSSVARISISKGRFEAFSDGIFAIAITLLVLEFRPPDLGVASDRSLADALLAMWPQYLVYLASFGTIGIMWFNHYALFHNVKTVSYGALVANLVLLLLVSFLPFPTNILGRYGLMPTAVVYYGLTLIGLSICFSTLYYSASLKPHERGSVAGYMRTLNRWNTVGFTVYVAGTLIGYFYPVVAIVLFTIVAFYYLLPQTVGRALSVGDGEGAGSE